MFAALPPDASLPPWILNKGSISAVSDTDSAAKYQVFDQILEFISRVDRFQVVAPALTRDSTFNHLAEEALTNDLEIEVVFPDPFFDLLCDRFPQVMREIATTGNFSAYTLDDIEPPYGFGLGYREDSSGIIDTTELAIVCYDENHYSANGTIVTTSPAAVTWGQEQYKMYKSNSTERTSEVLELDQ
jgi:predicted transcriptional regulator